MMEKMEPIYIMDEEADQEVLKEHFETLLDLDWLELRKARKELFMSWATRTYQYDDIEYTSIKFHPVVQDMVFAINGLLGYRMNVCFLNLYEDEKNALGWHADDTEGIDHEQPIVVVSFGAEREIWWKEKGYKGEIPADQKQLLENGSIFIMPAGFQANYLHKIPKHSAPCGPRISLTFRKFKMKGEI